MNCSLPIAVVFITATVVVAQSPTPKEPTNLSLEVTALQSLHNFNLTPSQLDQMAKALKRDPVVDRKRVAGTMSEKLQAALSEVRTAYANGDETIIADALTKFDKLYMTESSDLDDAVVISADARKRTPEFVRQLSPGQVANYFAFYSTQWRGPAERLMEGLMAHRKLIGDEWTEARNDLATDIAWLMAGCNDDAFDEAKSRVVEFLDRAHKLNEDELPKHKQQLEETVRKMTLKLGPVEILKNAMERDVAALLSNPRLAAAVELRQRKIKK